MTSLRYYRLLVCVLSMWPLTTWGTQFGQIPINQVIGTPSITNDTNITLTLGGTPTDAVLKPFSITVGWTGQLSTARGGVPSGGTTGQALTKNSNTSYDIGWSTISAGGGGTVTSIMATAPIVVTPSPLVSTGVISLGVADTTHNGYLSSTDWNTFNGKQNTITPSALTKTDDTNVTLSLGGTPTTALLNSVSITAGWTGTLAVSRGGTGGATAPAHDYFGNNTGTTAAPSFHQIDYSELSGTPTVPADVSALHFVTTQAEAGLSNEFSLGSLGNGLLKQSVTAGVSTPAIAVSGTDYAPATSGSSILYGNGSGGFSNVTVGSGLSFITGTLTATGSGGTVTTTGSPATGNLTKFSGTTSITNGDLSGDVTTSGTLATTIANSAVTYTKMQNVSANSKLLGSSATGSGAPPSEITLGTNLSMSGSTLNASGGGSVSITATSPIVVTPTPLTGTGVVSFATNVNLGMTVAQSETVTDASSSTVSDVLTLDHESTAAGTNFGTALLFSAHDSSTASIGMGEIQSIWTNATHNSNVSKFVFHLNNGSTAFVTPATLTGGGIFDVSSGYTIGAAAQSGYILQGDGTKYTKSTSTWPTTAVGAGSKIVVSDGTNFIMSSATYPGTSGSGKMIQSDGTNWVASTATWPTTNTAGYYVMSNGTNYLDYPADLENTSVASVSAGYSADTYLTGSTITIAAGDFKVNGVYHCKFDMTKTAAGTATPIITLRMGTAGTTSDAAIGTLTFGAGTAVADTGIFDVDVVFRTVGGGTSAVVQIMGECGHLLAATGMTSTGAAGTAIILATSSGFASTTQTKIGLSFNGGTSFSGTNTLVTASLHQP